VQTVAVRMVVEREREIEAFVKTEYWTIASRILRAKLPPKFDARLYKIEDKTVKTGGFDQDLKKTKRTSKTKRRRKEIVAEAEKKIYRRFGDDERAQTQSDAAVYHFEIAAGSARKLGFSVKSTMTTAQKLYEGVEVGKKARSV
jgi:DNA topoisomerase-1